MKSAPALLKLNFFICELRITGCISLDKFLENLGKVEEDKQQQFLQLLVHHLKKIPSDKVTWNVQTKNQKYLSETLFSGLREDQVLSIVESNPSEQLCWSAVSSGFILPAFASIIKENTILFNALLKLTNGEALDTPIVVKESLRPMIVSSSPPM